MLRWNDEYGIKLIRLSSYMFPFAGNVEYSYRLTPFVSDVLAKAGKIIAELSYRVITYVG